MKSVLDTTTRELARALNAVRSTASLDRATPEDNGPGTVTDIDDNQADGA
jgi:hypothetical protein